jgi:hypothetical protein
MTASAFGVTLTNTAHLYAAAAENSGSCGFFTDVLELTPRQPAGPAHHDWCDWR